MTISSQVRKSGPFVGNDSSTVFPFTFKVFSSSDMYVVKTDTDLGVDTTLVLNTDYTVSLNADQNTSPGGTITLPIALATGFNLTVTSSLQYLQPTDLTNQGGFYPSVITNALDRLTILCQQLFDSVGRSLKVSVSTPAGVQTTLPPPAANMLIGWNPTADNLQNMNPAALATVVAFGTANADLFDGDGATTQFALSANPGALNNLDVSIGGVTQTPGLDYTWSAGTTITFTSPPPAGTDNVLVRYMQGLPQGSTAADLVSYTPGGGGAQATNVNAKLREFVSVKDFGAVGDGVTDDTAAIRAAWNSIADGGELTFPSASAYKITDTLQFFDKGRVRIDFNGQLIDASGFTGGARPALHFKGISHGRIGGIFVIGNLASVSHGVLFDADADSITIHAVVGKIHASGCNIGVMVGNDQGYQFSDSSFDDIYGADCNIGVYFTGENTLAMYYRRVAAYNNNTYGVLIEQGGGCIASLQVADSGIDIYFGAPAGTNGNKLNRWDITSGYSEEGANGEVFIGSTACADTNPFREQIVLRGFRCTPFSSTNIEDFIRWNLNGDLIFRECTFTHGTQLPKAKLDANGAYRAPRLVFDECVIDCAPTNAVQVPLIYQVTTTKQRVDMDCAVNNGMTFWQNNGSANEGLIKRGIYTSKIKLFEQALRNVAGLKGAWSLRDITSGQCENLVADMPNLSLSASAQRRDVWMDDGLIGFFKNATTSKTLSTTSAVYAAGEYTFGCFLRTTVAGVDETDFTALGGAGGINLAVGDTGGGFVRCMVGGTNAQGTPTHPLDPHLVIGRYVPGASVKMSAINLRTGEVIQASAGSGPALVDLTWANGVSLRNDFCVRGFPFVYSRALTDNEVGQILQAAMLLTDSWRQ